MKTLKEIKSAFESMSQVFYSETTNHAEILLEMCKQEEKGHRGWGPDFSRYHTADTASVTDAARLFAVKRVAEYILTGKYPAGRAFIHTQKSCFLAAAIADEYGAAVVEAWTKDMWNLNELAALDYCNYVKVINKKAEFETTMA